MVLSCRSGLESLWPRSRLKRPLWRKSYRSPLTVETPIAVPKDRCCTRFLVYVLHTVSRKLLGIAYVNRLNNAKQQVPADNAGSTAPLFRSFQLFPEDFATDETRGEA